MQVQARRFLVLYFVAVLLANGSTDIVLAQAEIDPVTVGCERWHKGQSFEDLRSCFLSVVHRRERKANVEAMLGPGERVTIPNKVWDPPTEAYSYTPVDRINFHYVALYQNDIVVGYCCYSLDSKGKSSVILP